MKPYKPYFSRFRNTALALSAAVLMSQSTGCNQVERTLKRLEGDWEVDTWIINDENQFPYLSESLIEFEQDEDDAGEFVWSWQTAEGECLYFEGDYEIDESGERIDMEALFGFRRFDFSFSLEVDGDDLTLIGIGPNDEAWEVGAHPAATSPNIASCELGLPSDRPDLLEGEWEIQSWEIPNGDYLDYLTRSTFSFEGLQGGLGNFTWRNEKPNSTLYSGGRYQFIGEDSLSIGLSNIILILRYTLDNQNTQLTLEGNDLFNQQATIIANRQ